jgi:FkbM family methyltransferase
VNASKAIAWIAAFALVLFIIGFYPPLWLGILALAGHSPDCPLSQAIHSQQNLDLQLAIKDRLLASSKLLETDDLDFHHWQTAKGLFWIPKGSDFILPYNLAEQERQIYGTRDHFVRPGEVVLDCGANVGVFVNEALKAGARIVVAIEPAPENLECLRRNFASQIKTGSVIIYPKGVWDKDDFLSLNVDEGNSAADSFVLRPENATPTVEKLPLTTIDKLVAELHLDRVDFIKMDVEGAEPKAITGARQTLVRYHPRLSVSVYHQPEQPAVISKLVQQAWPGYRRICGPCSYDNGMIRPDVLWFQ